MSQDGDTQKEHPLSEESIGRGIPHPLAFALSFLAIVVAIISATLTGLIALTQGDRSIVILLVVLWAVAPYVLLGIVSWKSQRHLAASAVMLTSSGVICGPSLYLLYDAFYVHIDALNGLVFMFLPCLQWGAILLAGAVAITLQLKPGDLRKGR